MIPQPTALLDVPIFELMKLWGELIEAYHGVNGYAGSVAEIYAYRFQPYRPSIHHPERRWPTAKEDGEAMAVATNHKLVQLCALFEQTYDCYVYINDHPLASWPLDWHFEHRVHVLINKKRRLTNG